MLVTWAAAAGAPTADPGWVSYLGPFIPFAVLALWWIVWLHKQISDRDARIKELTDRIIAQGETLAPLVTEATSALSEAARELERRSR